MATPAGELHRPQINFNHVTTRSSDEEHTFIGEDLMEDDQISISVNTTKDSRPHYRPDSSPSRDRIQEHRLNDDLEMLQAERVVSQVHNSHQSARFTSSGSMSRTRSRRAGPVDEFDTNANPVHEKNAIYRPPEHPTTNFAKIFRKIHNSSFLIRYFFYIIPIVAILLIPLLLGALVFKQAHVGGVELLWFSVWLEIVWLTLWAGRILAKCIPWPLGIVASLFTNNSKKWRDLGKQLEIPATVFFWWLGIEVSFLPTMNNHQIAGYTGDQEWKSTLNKTIVAIFVGTTLNFFEKVVIQLIAISFHLRTYADRIELNKFQIGSLVKLYQYSKSKIAMDDSEFEEGGPSNPASGNRTPMQYLEKAQKNVAGALNKVGDVAGKVAGDFTGKQVHKSTHPHQVILTLLHTTSGSQVLARRLFRTFVREGTETVFSDDLKPAFDNDEEAEAAFTMFDKDLNGDISMEELESVCVEIGRERKSITASLKDLDSVISKLDGIFFFIVIIVTILVLITLMSTSAAGVLTSAGSTVLALSWLFSATAQEFLQSIIFVFVKHPFDVGDRVSIYGNTGASMKGDDYFVKKISLLYTEFKKMEGHVVQAPNSYLNTLFILNMRRSGGVAEAIPLVVKFGTTLDQIEELRDRLLEFVTAEKREYQGNILTEIREVTEAHSVTLNVVFFYKSNWQNELLRLQRRNKFICAMMVSMQEIGIEGPRMRIAGQKEEVPLYVHNPATRINDTGSHSENSPGPHSGSLARDQPFVPNAADRLRHHPSTLSSSPSVAHGGGRPRGESITAMSKRVDFSLGMQDVSSGNMMADVYDDNVRARLPNPSVSHELDVQKAMVENADGHKDGHLGRTTSRDSVSRSRFGLPRSSTESPSRLRNSLSTSRRNRFFGRRGKGDMPEEAHEDLMEQGMADIPEVGSGSRRGDARSRASSPPDQKSGLGRNDGQSGGGVDGQGRSPWEQGYAENPPLRSQTDGFEMKRLRG